MLYRYSYTQYTPLLLICPCLFVVHESVKLRYQTLNKNHKRNDGLLCLALCCILSFSFRFFLIICFKHYTYVLF